MSYPDCVKTKNSFQRSDDLEVTLCLGLHNIVICSSPPPLKFMASVVLHPVTAPFAGREDIVGGLRPYAGFRVGVVGVDKSPDVRLQLTR